MMHGTRSAVGALALVAALAATAGAARAALPVEAVDHIQIPPLNVAALAAEDLLRDSSGEPARFAVPHAVIVTPATDGTWEQLDNGLSLWRLRISSPGAPSLNLGFTHYWMPPGGALYLSATDGSYKLPPFTAADNSDHGQLWTPVVLSDDVLVTVQVPTAVAHRLILELASINVGYRFFGATQDKAGSCNVDVICPQGDPWRDQIKSVGVYTLNGSWTCTGAAINNTAGDRKPYFLTANHCGINSGNAATLVVYWNFFSPVCGQHGGGSLSQFQTGATWRASYSSPDFTLVELTQNPQPAFDVYLAGWDRTSANPQSSTCIHHPGTDEKSISFDFQPAYTTSYGGTSSPGDGTHIYVDWDPTPPYWGITEPGSSGSPLFNQDKRIVGQLHGGPSSCTSSNKHDYYGRLSVSWTGGGTNSSRLSNWLDPLGTGATAIDGLPFNLQSGLKVTPYGGFAPAGNAGGPFSPSSVVYTLQNLNATPLSYQVTKNVSWLSLTNASGTIPASGTATVTVALTAAANYLGNGSYTDTLVFTNLTDHDGDTTRPVTLTIGVPTLQYSWNLDTNPGWTTQGQWAWGTPTGGGGQYGSPDPTSGKTGTRVYGYNLNGDYPNNMPEYHLTSTAIDCSQLTQVRLKYWRWLGVESPTYDHAYVRVSNNGTTWTTVWQNTARIDGGSWVFEDLDISAVANNRPTVYLRWTMGTTDSSWQFCGWNIDDIEVWGLAPSNPPLRRGDLNCDGVVNFDDIDPFVLALGGEAGYSAAYPACHWMNADCNQDGTVNFDDIDAFVGLIGS